MSVRRTVAALLASGLLLTGCGDDPEPRFEPAPDPTPTESTASAEPEAQTQTPEEFIREWVELDNEMTTTGDTTAFREASRGCGPCKSYADRVEGIYSAGGFIRTDGRTVVSVREADGPRAFELEIRSAPSKYREDSSGRIKSLPGGSATLRLVLSKREGTWVVADEVQL